MTPPTPDSLMQETTVFRKTDKGLAEIERRAFGLAAKLRRALILIDGGKDVAELSVLMRPGEAEETCIILAAEGFIEIVPEHERDPARVAQVPAASDPAVFAEIKQRAINEISYRIGPVATLLLNEIDSCGTAPELRLKLRNIENVLVNFLGEASGQELARAIGTELTRLVPRAV